jgi:hypothetical protein
MRLKGPMSPRSEAQAYRLVEAPRKTNLSERFFGRYGRVGLRGLLADTNREATWAEVPGEAAIGGYAWQRGDSRTRRWLPQGITTSADAYGPDPTAGTVGGRHIVLASWYANHIFGFIFGSRISVMDCTDADSAPYRHVLLVNPRKLWGVNWLTTIRVHAGGIVWYGKYLYVAGGQHGIRVFRLDDIVRVRNRFRTKSYRYVLPQFTEYDAGHDKGVGEMMYSFMSLDRSGDQDHLVAGEYGRKGGSHRLMRYPLDRETELLRRDDRGWAIPAELYDRQVERMQGATLVDGTWVITASNGKGKPGDLWVGRPGQYVRHAGVLPTGPEDVTYWPQRRQLWSLTEWPRQRWVYAIDADTWATTEPRDT